MYNEETLKFWVKYKNPAHASVPGEKIRHFVNSLGGKDLNKASVV